MVTAFDGSVEVGLNASAVVSGIVSLAVSVVLFVVYVDSSNTIGGSANDEQSYFIRIAPSE